MHYRSTVTWLVLDCHSDGPTIRKKSWTPERCSEDRLKPLDTSFQLPPYLPAESFRAYRSLLPICLSNLTQVSLIANSHSNIEGRGPWNTSEPRSLTVFILAVLRGMWDPSPQPGIEPVSPALEAWSQPLAHQGSPLNALTFAWAAEAAALSALTS